MREASLVLIAGVRWKAGKMVTASSSADRIKATSAGRKAGPGAISIVASLFGASRFNVLPYPAKVCSIADAGTFNRKFPLRKPCPHGSIFSKNRGFRTAPMAVGGRKLGSKMT